MSRVVSPPLDELHALPTPLTSGERRVLDFFLEHLPIEWKIYIQPHLNGLRPDFVLLPPRNGIAVYEVNWDLAVSAVSEPHVATQLTQARDIPPEPRCDPGTAPNLRRTHHRMTARRGHR